MHEKFCVRYVNRIHAAQYYALKNNNRKRYTQRCIVYGVYPYLRE